MINRNLKAFTYGVLRNCDLMGGKYTETCGKDAGKTTYFVRCIPYPEGLGTGAWKELTDEKRREILNTVLADLKANNMDGGCIISNNPDFGGDYLRVEHGSSAYWLICHMKS